MNVAVFTIDGQAYIPRGRHSGMVLATCLSLPAAVIPLRARQIGLDSFAAAEALYRAQLTLVSNDGTAWGAPRGGGVWYCVRCDREFWSPSGARKHRDHRGGHAVPRVDQLVGWAGRRRDWWAPQEEDRHA